MADADRLGPARPPGGVAGRRQNPGRALLIGLAPRRPEWVTQVDPVPGGAQRTVSDSDAEPLEVIPRLDQPLIDLGRQAKLLSYRRGGLDGSVPRGRAAQGHVMAGH